MAAWRSIPLFAWAVLELRIYRLLWRPGLTRALFIGPRLRALAAFEHKIRRICLLFGGLFLSILGRLCFVGELRLLMHLNI